jgi:phospholipid/cholesterol/gamma-HCH transport system substrate-binding protein
MSTRRPTTLRGRAVRLVLTAVVAALALSGCDFSVYSLPLPGGADLGDRPYKVTIQFRDVLDLVPQSAVKVDDVTVGRVDTIKTQGYHAEVTVLIRRSVKLPDDAEATIRQTSLLGEKFVSLAPPPGGGTGGRLSDGDRIPLSRSGRNPEVEEVLGALSLLLNGGGVAQLKTISSELNSALAGREGNVRSVLAQLDTFMGQLDTNKDQIVRAIESLNRLAVVLNKQKPAITQALDELPRAVASINRQRDDLVRMLKALSHLSGVATRVIRDSKTATIDSLRALAPTLTKLAEAGDALPKSLQVFLTYPFVDAVVGKNPAQARNLHMGDYTNLSVQLDLNLAQVPTLPTVPLPSQLCDQDPTNTLCNPTQTLTDLQKCLQSGDLASKACKNIGVQRLITECKKDKYKGAAVCQAVNRLPSGVTGPVGDVLNRLGGSGGSGGGSGGGGTGPLPPLPSTPVPGLGRAPFGASSPSGAATAQHVGDSDLGALLVWGMMQR